METGIGKRIKERRLELGLSQEELAHRMGLKSKSTICKIERGEDNLTAPTLKKYADALNTTSVRLLDNNSSDDKNDTFDSLLTREVYKHFTPEQLDDPVLAKQIGEFLAFLKRLDSNGRDTLLAFAKTLKF